MNMIWTNFVSVEFIDFGLENSYKFYHSIGENSAILLDDMLSFKPKDGYVYDEDIHNE